MQVQRTTGEPVTDDLTSTLANTRIYLGTPCPAVHPSVYESWARGEWAGNDESWFTELAQLRPAGAR